MPDKSKVRVHPMYPTCLETFKFAKSSIWACLYSLQDATCWHVEYGQADGPEMDLTLARALAEHYAKNDPNVECICILQPGTAKQAHW